MNWRAQALALSSPLGCQPGHLNLRRLLRRWLFADQKYAQANPDPWLATAPGTLSHVRLAGAPSAHAVNQ